MLHQSKSSKLNMLKIFIIIPILALFLWSFNTETVYVPKIADSDLLLNVVSETKTIEIKIDKDTSDKELEDLKKDLAKKGIDFSYTVVHNEKKEIIDLSISISSKKNSDRTFQGKSSFNNDGEPIDPVTIVFDKDNNVFFMGEEGMHTRVHEEKNISTWVHADDDIHQTVEIYKDNGKEVIRVNGKEVTREEYEKMEEEGDVIKNRIKIIQSDDGEAQSHIMIMSDGDHDIDHDVEVISGDGGSFFFMNGELDDDWLIVLDGKEVDRKAIKDLGPDDVETINVLKGKSASKKYGAKAKKGVVEITTSN